MNQHPPGQHLPSCTSPRNCAEYAALLVMSPEDYSRYLAASTARALAAMEMRAAASVENDASSEEEDDDTPLDTYAADVQTLRGAAATSSFEDRFKAERLTALQSEYDEIDAEFDAITDAMTDEIRAAAEEDLSRYVPPNPYALKKES